MKFQWSGGKKSFAGLGLVVTANGEEKAYCADCFWVLRKEYEKKKTCEDRGLSHQESCKKTRVALVPVKAGYNSYFAQAETCKNDTTEKKGSPDKKKQKELTQTEKKKQLPSPKTSLRKDKT